MGRTLQKVIRGITQSSLKHPVLFLTGATLLTVVSVWLARGLEIRSSFDELLPPNVASVVHIKELVQRVGGDGTVLVNIESLDDKPDLSHAEVVARQLADEYLRLGPSAIRSVEYNVHPVEQWYADHWPLFASLDDLNKANDALRKK